MRTAAIVNGYDNSTAPEPFDEYEPVAGSLFDDILDVVAPGTLPAIDFLGDQWGKRYADIGPEATTSFENASKAWKELEPLIKNDPNYPDRKLALERLAEWQAFEREWRSGVKDANRLNSMIGLLNGIQRDFKKPSINGFDIEGRDVLTRAAVELGQTGPNQDANLWGIAAAVAVGLVGLVGLGVAIGR